jgi:isoleucyl-tRNA synthetase
MVVRPGDAGERSALASSSLRDQLLEELNVKQIELVESTDGLVELEARPNFKQLGPRYGSMMKKIQARLSQVDAHEVRDAFERETSFTLEVDGQQIELATGDVELTHRAPEGLAFVFERGSFAALDTTLTPELEREGIARDFVRGVQNERKALDLEVADRIRLRFRASEGIRLAVQEWEAYIRRETLAVELSADESLDEGSQQGFKAGGVPVVVALERVRAD